MSHALLNLHYIRKITLTKDFISTGTSTAEIITVKFTDDTGADFTINAFNSSGIPLTLEFPEKATPPEQTP